VNLEHTPCDAPAIASMVQWSMEKIHAENPTVAVLPSSDLPTPTKLNFKLTKDQEAAADKALKDHEAYANTKDYKVAPWTDYGSEWLKLMKVSPDAFMQMVLQLAYFKLHRKGTPTYETGHWRLFRNGRTETVRTFSLETDEWTRAMEDPKTLPSTKWLLFQRAVNGHLAYMADAVNGRGCDRIFYAMNLVHQEKVGGPLPKFFSDPSLAASKHYRLSTSNVPGECYWGGFGNVVSDGYGVNYIIKKKRIDVTMCADNNNAGSDLPKFREAVFESFKDLRVLVETVRAAKL